jgi:hypothetical protein
MRSEVRLAEVIWDYMYLFYFIFFNKIIKGRDFFSGWN